MKKEKEFLSVFELCISTFRESIDVVNVRYYREHGVCAWWVRPKEGINLRKIKFIGEKKLFFVECSIETSAKLETEIKNILKKYNIRLTPQLT